MDRTYPQRLHKYELALRGFFLKALRLQIKPYTEFYISHGYLGRPEDLIGSEGFFDAYNDAFRYISDADTYLEWKRQDFEYKSTQKDFSLEDGFLVISETLKSFFVQSGISYYNNIKDDITQTTIDKINAFVSRARLQGYTDDQIYQSMSTTFQEELRNRSKVFADTEAHSIMNLVKRTTAMKYFDQRGIVGYHSWLTRQDERVRHTHEEVDRVTLPVDVKFVLKKRKGGIEFASYPGDLNLSPENRVGCRCMEDIHSDPYKYKKGS